MNILYPKVTFLDHVCVHPTHNNMDVFITRRTLNEVNKFLWTTHPTHGEGDERNLMKCVIAVIMNKTHKHSTEIISMEF